VLKFRSFFACLAVAGGIFTTVTCTQQIQLVQQGSVSMPPHNAPPTAASPAGTPTATAAGAPVAVLPTATPPSRTAKPTPVTPTKPPQTVRPSGTPLPAGGGSGSVQADLTNQARAAGGLPPLQWNSCLAGVAQQHAEEMAQAGHIYHGDGVQRDLGCGQGVTRAGENVGMTSPGIDDQRIFNGFMNSPGHKANILGPYRYIGTAWVSGSDGAGYVSVEFSG